MTNADLAAPGENVAAVAAWSVAFDAMITAREVASRVTRKHDTSGDLSVLWAGQAERAIGLYGHTIGQFNTSALARWGTT